MVCQVEPKKRSLQEPWLRTERLSGNRFEASNVGESTTTWMNFEPMAREILAKPGRNELWQAQDLP